MKEDFQQLRGELLDSYSGPSNTSIELLQSTLRGQKLRKSDKKRQILINENTKDETEDTNKSEEG